jgi:hypothetical protein
VVGEEYTGPPIKEAGKVLVKLKRHYRASDQSALEKKVSELQAGLASLKAETASEVTLDLESSL